MDIRKISISAVADTLAARGSHFFERSTLRFFNDRIGNWDAFYIGARLFIRNARHSNGPGMFARCTLRGQVREIMPDGDLIARPYFEGMTARQIARAIAAAESARLDALRVAAPAMLDALRIVARCVADDCGGVTLGSYEMGKVRAAIAAADSTTNGENN
jgi:hypothetical protein